MGQVDALKMVENVRGRLVDLAMSENYVRDHNLSSAIHNVWNGSGNDGGLVSELWVEGAFPGEHSQDTLQSLSEEGIFPKDLCKHLHNRDFFPSNRNLYNHQSEALRISSKNSKENPALIITAGTGLGKTEAFLLPMLKKLWNSPRKKNEGGMRSLILYPMNALVADQVNRIYQWLQGQDRLTVFHFTSETPENHRQANKQGEPQWGRCRIRTREEARGFETHEGKPIHEEPFGKVPDIVVTNYSMLEYMLCRPQDYRFFGPDLQSIILDEAHLYSGTLAAEITMLLRRVRERCGVSAHNILHIATSATLGGNEEELQDYASSLFSTHQLKTMVIRGRYADHDLGDIESHPDQKPSVSEIAEYVNFDFSTLTEDENLFVDDSETVDKLYQVAVNLVSSKTADIARQKYSRIPACFLYESLSEAPLFRRMAEILTNEKGNVISLNELSENIFGSQTNEHHLNATIVLLRLGAVSRLRALDLPLLPHRLHFLVRSPEGLSVCLNSNCSGPSELKIASIGCLQSINDHCKYCDHILLPIHRCDNCGEWALAAHENQETSILEPEYYAESIEHRTYYLLARPKKLDLEEVIVNSESGEIRGYGAEGVSLWKAPYELEKSPKQRCPTCHSSWYSKSDDADQPAWKQTCRHLVGGQPLFLSVTAETALHDLPAFKGTSRNWKPAHGRRLLAFSDSRAAAARLGPLLTQQHEIRIVRAAIARSANKLTPSGSLEYFSREVKRLQDELKKPEIDETLKVHLRGELEEKKKQLHRSKTGTAFSDFAKIVAEREEIEQIMDRELSERHSLKNYDQDLWKQNKNALQDKIEGLVAKELDRPLKKQPTVESIGLIEFVYPGIESLGIPPIFEEKLTPNTRSKIAEVWPKIVTLLLDTARFDGCVGWSDPKKPGRKWLDESPLAERWLTRTKGGWGSIRFVGTTENQLRRTFLSNVLKSAGCNEDKLKEFSHNALCAVFYQLFDLAANQNHFFSWLQREESHQTNHEEADKAIQILLDRLNVRIPTHLYRCEATGTIWTNSALGWAPIEGCIGTLKETTSKILDEDIRWGRSRRELRESPIFSIGLWAEEHSAQLAPQENMRLQDLFKSGIRNILSSTTTMELGIDIGGLNGVLLGNVPPGPANHRQRAGRAGRRSDGSAVVITYARNSRYDREVFNHFGTFLKKELRKPVVFLDRERIIRRHLHAVLLSDFLRSKQPQKTGAMHAFGRMGKLCGVNTEPTRWRYSSEPKPSWSIDGVDISKQFIEYLNELKHNDTEFRNRLSDLSQKTVLDNIEKVKKWHQFIEEAISIFQNATDDWKQDTKQLKEAWDEIPTHPNRSINREKSKANNIRHMVRTLREITVIEWLADRRFLPRYGFPINLQKLSVRKPINENQRDYSEPDERYRLERSSLLALSEYIPESKVLVGGRIATSRGLRKHWTDNNVDQALGLQYFSLQCMEGHVYISQSLDELCPRCNNEPEEKQPLVLPRFGYTTAAWEDLPLGTNLERIGEQIVSPTAFTEQTESNVIEKFGGISGVKVSYREEATLLVRNSGKNGCGFAICTQCGFAMSETEYGDGRIGLHDSFKTHASIFSTNSNSFCWEKNGKSAPVLRNRVLAARELTDMLLFEWPSATMYLKDGVYSLGIALKIAGTKLLELDERELGMELLPLRNSKLGIVLYDTAPGGAGHCQELIGFGREWIDNTYDILYVNDEHHSRCEKACLDCILDFSAQYSANRLDRRSALSILEDVY